MTVLEELLEKETSMNEARERRLWVAGILFGVASGIHLIDHLRRGQGSITDTLYLLGNVGLVFQITTITLVLTRNRLAPMAAVFTGFPLAIGFAAAHWVPTWSAMSDPVWKIRSLTWFSYLASSAEIAGALAVAFAGLAILRARGFALFAVTSETST
jgi:hypothetical protein